jgi:anti-anti-sigma factor
MPLPNRTLRILTIDQGHTVRIGLNGELDRATLVALARELLDCDRGNANVVVIDLAALGFLDGAAFRMLLDFGRRLRASGRHLSLVNPSPQVRRILEVSAMVHAADVLDEWLEEPAGNR